MLRNGVDQVVQLRYGEDGLDAMWVEDQPIATMRISTDQFEREYRLNPTDERQLRELYTGDVVREIRVSFLSSIFPVPFLMLRF